MLRARRPKWPMPVAVGLLLGVPAALGAEQQPEPHVFRAGELAARVAEAADFCRERGGEAVLLGIDRVSSPEGSTYRARFQCGTEAQTGIPVTYESRDFSQIREDIAGYCRARGKAELRFTSEPAASATVLRGTFSCG